ncbi:polyprenyl synthetase family protein [Peredibacter starrii]|uniref:Polyprenyl synthetase family protein n=1 Tax=Peredibacter starrii TaxID=28202 RepID=A0AAX4HPK9_9BACT|nr:polyprenyl synthetase family protein [Peredibacter starrii]WPU65132.1 polyprenyl synthetase family protein [Peredibacter starrii]
MNDISKIFPETGAWEKLLALNNPCDLNTVLGKSLIDPVNDFFQKPGKNIRPRLVELGYRLAFDSDPVEIPEEDIQKLKLAGHIVELIHGGSLIVDDIQDGSHVRRNAPTFHLQHGLPVALNAGNWLYFWALGQIKELKLSNDSTQKLLDIILGLMIRAHFGQAVDLGTRIDEISQSDVEKTCYASMELKTGTLLCLALQLGAAVSNREPAMDLNALGNKLGFMLQLFDDFGNFAEEKKSSPSKRYEDLYNRRPTWAWAQASKLDSDTYSDFLSAIRQLPNEDQLEQWILQHEFINLMWLEARGSLTRARDEWRNQLHLSHPFALETLLDLCSLLEKSYVKKT